MTEFSDAEFLITSAIYVCRHLALCVAINEYLRLFTFSGLRQGKYKYTLMIIIDNVEPFTTVAHHWMLLAKSTTFV